MTVTHPTTLYFTSLCLCVIVCVFYSPEHSVVFLSLDVFYVVLFVQLLTQLLCCSPLCQIFLFVCVGNNSKDKFSQYFLLDQFVAISQAVHGNQPGDPWKSTPVRADYPRFSSDCLMIALPPDKAHTSSAKIITQHYPSKLSDLKIIPHLPTKLSLISASLVNSPSTFCNKHLPAGSIKFASCQKISEKQVQN